MAAKYEYTLKVTKTVRFWEINVSVPAENEVEARELIEKKCKEHPELFDGWERDEIFKMEAYSISCNPVEE